MEGSSNGGIPKSSKIRPVMTTLGLNTYGDLGIPPSSSSKVGLTWWTIDELGVSETQLYPQKIWQTVGLWWMIMMNDYDEWLW